MIPSLACRPRSRPFLASSLALAVLTLCPAPARADEPAPAVADRSRAEQILDADELASKRWYYGWSGGFAGLTAAYLTVGALSHSTTIRQETYLTAASTTVGLLATVFTFSPAAFAPARIRAMPVGTEAERAARQQAAEDAVERAAKVERFTRSWLARIGGLALNAATFSIRWFVFEHRIPAVYNAVISFAVGEARVWSLPTGALAASPTAHLAPWFDRGGGGLSLTGSW